MSLKIALQGLLAINGSVLLYAMVASALTLGVSFALVLVGFMLIALWAVHTRQPAYGAMALLMAGAALGPGHASHLLTGLGPEHIVHGRAERSSASQALATGYVLEGARGRPEYSGSTRQPMDSKGSDNRHLVFRALPVVDAAWTIEQPVYFWVMGPVDLDERLAQAHSEARSGGAPGPSELGPELLHGGGQSGDRWEGMLYDGPVDPGFEAALEQASQSNGLTIGTPTRWLIPESPLELRAQAEGIQRYGLLLANLLWCVTLGLMGFWTRTSRTGL